MNIIRRVQNTLYLDFRSDGRKARRVAKLPRKSTTAAVETERASVLRNRVAKSKSPDWEKKTIYVRKRTARDALRKYEDRGGKEFSELIEQLLGKYLGT